MNTFRDFLEAGEQETNLKDALDKLPKAHSALVRRYKYKWEGGNTLKGDDGHVGIINPNSKTITIAAPWNYPRQFTLLHELGHKVFETFIKPKEALVKKWEAVVKETHGRLKKQDPEVARQNAEELFCHAYAQFYCDTKVKKFDHPEWMQFIDNLPQA